MGDPPWCGTVPYGLDISQRDGTEGHGGGRRRGAAPCPPNDAIKDDL